jgi:hypothetical protein
VPLSRTGHFDVRGGYQAKTPTGNVLVVRYRLFGRVSKIRTRRGQRNLLLGAFQVRAGLREAGGGYRIRNCPTPLIFFEAER